LAGHDRDVALRDAEGAGDDLNQLGIGGPFDRRRLESDEQRAVARSRDARLAGSRDDANEEGIGDQGLGIRD
jgi:hypothetical protein